MHLAEINKGMCSTKRKKNIEFVIIIVGNYLTLKFCYILAFHLSVAKQIRCFPVFLF